MVWNKKYGSRHCERFRHCEGDSPKQSGTLIYSGLLRSARNDVVILLLFLTSCSVSYKFEGGSVNYDKTKTIHIADFPNRTPFYSPLSSMFNLALRKRFIEQTRLKEVSSNADIDIDGEISNFSIAGTAVKSDAYASQTNLTITVHVKYTNNKESNRDVDQSFSSSKPFPSTQSLDDVQDTLVPQIISDLVDMIYNATIANW